MTKKGFMISPIIFIVFFLIAVVFSFYVSDIDKKISYGIQKSSVIEKGIHEIQKKQTNQINFAEIATYKCSEIYPYPCNKSDLVSCVEGNLTNKFGSWDWSYDIWNTSSTAFYFRFNITKFGATSINMSSNNSIVTKVLNKNLLNTTCS